MPRYMILVLGTGATEAGSSAEDISAMKKFNDSLREAGLLQTAEGLTPTSDAYRVSFGSETKEVEKGPFDLAKQGTISGYWFVKADSVDVVLESAKQIPFREGQVEIRRIAEAEDAGQDVRKHLAGAPQSWHGKITPDGPFKPEKGRYRLYIGNIPIIQYTPS
jgi:hypothetical protein